MLDEQLSGVETQDGDASAAGEQQQDEQDIFGLEGEETGEETPDAAGQKQAEEEQDDRVEKAFAKRLAAEKEKMRREIADELRRELAEELRQTQPQHSQQQQYPAQPAYLSREDAEKLADQFNTSVEMVYFMYNQQVAINQEKQEKVKLSEQLNKLNDNLTKNETFRLLEQKRKNNPGLPEVSETKLAEIRKNYRNKYGYDLPWEEAYDKLIAQEALSGTLSRKAEQETIAKITGRNQATVQAGKGGQAKKPSIDELSPDEFNKLIEEAKLGKFKKS